MFIIEFINRHTLVSKEVQVKRLKGKLLAAYESILSVRKKKGLQNEPTNFMICTTTQNGSLIVKGINYAS